MSAVRNIDSVRLITSLYDAALNCDNPARKEAVQATTLWSLEMWSSSKWSEVEPVYCSESFWSLLLMSYVIFIRKTWYGF